MSDPYRPPQTDNLAPESVRLPAVAISGLLAVAITLERWAYYGVRAVLVIWLITVLDMADSEAFLLYGSLTTAVMLSPFLGGIVALLTGPYPLAVGGAVVMVAAYGCLPLVPGLPIFVPIALLALGQGLMKPAMYAIAGIQYRGDFANARTANFILLYGGVNLGAATSTIMLAPIADKYGHAFVFIPAAMAMSAVAVLCGIVWALDWNRPPEPAFDEATARRFAASLLILPLGMAFWMAVAAATELMYTAPPMWIFTLNPAVVMVCALFLFPTLVGLQLGRVRIPAFPVIGIGLLLVVPGAAILLLPGGFESASILVASTVLLAIPETLIGAFAVSRLTGDLPTRLTPLLIAGWRSAACVGNVLVSVASPRVGTIPVLTASIIVCGVAGIAAFALWKPLDWAAFDR